MRLSGTLLIPLDTPGFDVVEGTIIVEDDRIASVEPEAVQNGPIIMPGFIDAHLHLPQFDSIGATDGGAPPTLLRWLEDTIFPAEARWEDADHAESMTGRVGRTLLSHGTTGVCAFATVHHEATSRAMRALAHSACARSSGRS